MEPIIPNKLEKNDEIRIISPATSMAVISKESRKIAIKNLASLGLRASFGKNAEEQDNNYDGTANISQRVDDIHDAFADKNVKAIMTTLGGFNSNQLLNYLDYNLIKKNPKIFIGYSDITALQWAIYAKTGLVTYYGPAFGTFGMKYGNDYILDSFRKCLMSNIPYELASSKEWSDEKWWLDQDNRHFIKNKGPFTINTGNVKGKFIGGNLCTLNLLQGTEFMPNINNSILFIEDDYESKWGNFDRDLQSLIHQKGFATIKGLVIGRFQKESNISDDAIRKIISTKKELSKIPIIANLDYGHTFPLATLPIGGDAEIRAGKQKTYIRILHH